jgi:hypothetical protein
MHYEVTPSATDSSITDLPKGPSEVHKPQVRVPVSPINKLFLYMAGHSVEVSGNPPLHPSLLSHAEDAGYHVVGLEYMNSVGPAKCGDCSDCYYGVHSTLMYGYNHSSIIHITETDSILNRLTKLLAYLDQHHHNENWEQFRIAPDKPKWSEIVVAGHSFGGAQAALIAMLYDVPRVVMFASPVDAVKVNSVVESAQWMHRPHVTPIDRYFGFRHLDDDEFKAGTQANWTTMAMQGSTLVDNASPPYGHAHQLTTSQPPPGMMDPHQAVVKDESSYRQVWKYLIGP